jgi:hypothetical protein
MREALLFRCSRKFRDGVPGRGRAAFEKEGRPVQSVCFSIDALYAGRVEVDIQIHGRRREGQGSLRIDKNASQAGASQKRTARMEKCERG